MKPGNSNFYCTFLLVLLSFCFSCQSEEEKLLEAAMRAAGDNRVELEKVLEHYRKDKPKEAAARFLIINMQGHKRYDLSVVREFKPMYDKYVEISERYGWDRSSQWHEDINACWEKEQGKLLPRMGTQKQDIQTLKASCLIEEIDLAFKVWAENVYTRNCSFEDFCSYILPYRIQNQICLDDSRSQFASRHAGCFSDSTMSFIEAADSLLYQYHDLKHFDNTASSMPLLNAATFEQIKRGSCDDKTWFNTQLMSSLGMAVVTDFVPYWGNRSGGHSWNALIIDGETYPFEPFWDEDRWKYKIMYNNEGVDRVWGKFRLPKVFRNMYEYSLEGPMVDREVDRSDIPGLFLNPWIKDVSDQYFRTADVQIELSEGCYEAAKYCYLCVFDHKRWIPVQWGKINKDATVKFEKMGRDIVYLPALCKNGTMQPVAPPFLLHQDGRCEALVCSGEKTDIVVRTAKPYLHKDQIAEEKKWLSGSCLIGYANLDDPGNLLYEWTDSLDMWNNDVTLSGQQSYRYLRLIPPSDSVALCDLSFYEYQDNRPIRIQDVKVSAALNAIEPGETLDMIVDPFSGTGFKGVFKDKKSASEGLLFDLGKHYTLQALSFVPYVASDLEKDMGIELFYWDNRWISAAKKTGTGKTLVFDNIPSRTLYRVKRPHVAEQVFIYREGLVEWH